MDIFNVQYFSQNLFAASLICVSHVSLDLRSSPTQSKLLHTTFCEVIDMKTACKKKICPAFWVDIGINRKLFTCANVFLARGLISITSQHVALHCFAL